MQRVRSIYGGSDRKLDIMDLYTLLGDLVFGKASGLDIGKQIPELPDSVCIPAVGRKLGAAVSGKLSGCHKQPQEF